jgi:two-component sensor histidine kinase
VSRRRGFLAAVASDAMNPIDWLFGAASFVPHGVCLLWRPDLVALHAVSDVLIAGAYFAIPAAIWWFVKRRTDLKAEHRRIAVLFSAFIVWCGLTHVAGLITLWQPYYGVQALVKATTATVSVMTAFAVWPVLPKLLAIPSPSALAEANAKLTAALSELESVKADLERQVAERTEDLRVLNARFERALDGSPITVFEQDEDLVYTWIHNPQLGMAAAEVVGRRDEDVLDAEAAAVATALKREALAGGETRATDLAVATANGTAWFSLKTAPALLRDERPGLLSVAVDVTPQVRQQEHLRVILGELNHRSKNLLAMVQAIARQSGKGAADLAAFQQRFAERLQALAESHDVLVAADWSGADLRTLVERQLRQEMAERPGRVVVEGEPVKLAPEAAHYVGLALHELHVNAVKHGALSDEAGAVSVRWRRTEEGATLDWIESGGPAVTEPARRGFGRTLLETVAPAALGGTGVLSFTPEGVRYALTTPKVDQPTASTPAGRSRRSPKAKAASQAAASATASTL